MTDTCDPRPFLDHMLLAAAWVRYNSRSGKASEKQTLKVMERQSADVLRRMLSERNALPSYCDLAHSEAAR